MTGIFEDDSLGLRLKGYALVPNEMLETKIAVYTPEIVQSILSEHPEIVDRWLQKLHREYVSMKKSCDFENDPVACFSLSVYEAFERHFKSWEDGGIISITLPQKRIIRVSKDPLVSIVTGSKTSFLVCSKCMASFTDIDEFERHCRHEENETKVTIPKPQPRYDEVPPNPIWWFAT